MIFCPSCAVAYDSGLLSPLMINWQVGEEVVTRYTPPICTCCPSYLSIVSSTPSEIALVPRGAESNHQWTKMYRRTTKQIPRSDDEVMEWLQAWKKDQELEIRPLEANLQPESTQDAPTAKPDQSE